VSEPRRDPCCVIRFARWVATALSVSTTVLAGPSVAFASPSVAFASSPVAFAGPSAALGARAAVVSGVTYIPSLKLVPEFSAAGLGQGTMLTATLELGGHEYFGSVAPMTG
jgi:hypothetical protein